LIFEYFPALNAKQVKGIIEKSAIVCVEKVNIPGTTEKVSLSEISKTGAFANAYEAIKMAADMSAKLKLSKP
jgi:hypothetical protein